MIKRTIFSAATLMALTFQPASAQQHEHGDTQSAGPERGGMMEMMSGDMMGMMSGGMMDMSLMAFRPGALLQSAETLGLSVDQKARLQTLAERGHEEHGRHAEAAMTSHGLASSALGGDAPDLDAYAEALQSAVSHMAMAHVAMTRTALDARGILSADQRTQVTEAMHMMRGMMMQGGMMKPSGGMGQGGH